MDPRLQRAYQFVTLRRFEEAQRIFQEILASEPAHPSAMAGLGECAVYLENREEADRLSAELVAAYPDWSDSWLLRGESEFLNRRLKTAAEAAERVRALDPDEVGAYSLLARVAIRRARWQEAIEHCDQGLSIDPEDPSCTQFRVVALRQSGRAEEAGELAKAALQKQPEDATALANAGWNQLNLGQAKEARRLFEAALRLEPSNEFAKAGLLEALRAGHWFYRPVLRYRLLMSRLSPQWRVGVLVGGYLLFRVGLSSADTATVGGVLATIGVVAYLLFGLSTWFGSEVADGLLSLTRVGRLVRSRAERLWSLSICALLLVGVTMLALWWFDPTWTIAYGVVPILLAMPLHIGSELDTWKTKRLMLGFTVVCLVLGLLVIDKERQRIRDVMPVIAQELVEMGIDPTSEQEIELTDEQDARVSERVSEWLEEQREDRGRGPSLVLVFALLCSIGSQVFAGVLMTRFE
ncbi:MAG: tetratricopeptide repeat protein [Planctomycetota bacterium]